MGRQRKSVLDPHGDFIKEWIRQSPYLTLYALKDKLAARGAAVSYNAVRLSLRQNQVLDARGSKRAIDDISRHLGELIQTIQPDECKKCFANAGYASIKT